MHAQLVEQLVSRCLSHVICCLRVASLKPRHIYIIFQSFLLHVLAKRSDIHRLRDQVIFLNISQASSQACSVLRTS